MGFDQGKPCSSPHASFSSIKVPKYLVERETQKMAYMFVRHSVRDYDAWKSVFDSVGDLRKRNGEKSYQILRQDNGSNELVALFKWDSLDNARKYATSPELKAAMERAGVIGKPEILFLEEAAQG
jgi:heme-degrading monooxygenase HmoA